MITMILHIDLHTPFVSKVAKQHYEIFFPTLEFQNFSPTLFKETQMQMNQRLFN